MAGGTARRRRAGGGGGGGGGGPARRRRAERWLGWYVAGLLFFLALPILVVIPAAFGPDVTLTFPPRGLSLKWFKNVVDHPEFLRAFGVSLAVAVVATLVALLVGPLAAFGRV